MKTIKSLCFLLILALLFFNQGTKAQTWSPVGPGIHGPDIYCTVGALTVYNGLLCSAGYYDSIGNSRIYSVSSWNGTNWDSVGTGLSNAFGLSSLCVYNSNLYVGGNINHIGNTTVNNVAYWNGTSWDSMDMGLSGFVYSMTTYNSLLIVGGTLRIAGGIPVRYIASWNGSTWDTLGKGLNSIYFGCNCYALTAFNGNLYAGGSFDTAGRVSAKNIAMWNGSSWLSVGGGTNGTVYSFCVYNGRLIVGGLFDSAGGHPAKNIAAWDGSAWSNLGSGFDSTVYSLCVYNNNLYAGGSFYHAGGNPANNIAMWNGSVWSPLGSGTTGNGLRKGMVLCLCVYNGGLYVGGGFDSAGGQRALKIAKWTSPAGVNEVTDNNAVSIYPNPNHGEFSIMLPFSDVKPIVEIYNTLGQKIFSTHFIESNTLLSVNIGSQPAGIYLCRILSEEGRLIANSKIVVQ